MSMAIELSRTASDHEAAANRMQREADRLGHLAGDLLEATRQEADATSTGQGVVNVPSVLWSVVSDCEVEAQARGCRLAVETISGWHTSGSFELLRRALENARPVLLEPVMHVEVLVPEEWTGSVIGGLQSRHGVIERIEARGHLQAIRALVPLAATFGYTTDLRSASQGRGTFTMHFAHYAPAK
jgi:hypothetical protein